MSCVGVALFDSELPGTNQPTGPYWREEARYYKHALFPRRAKPGVLRDMTGDTPPNMVRSTYRDDADKGGANNADGGRCTTYRVV